MDFHSHFAEFDIPSNCEDMELRVGKDGVDDIPTSAESVQCSCWGEGGGALAAGTAILRFGLIAFFCKIYDQAGASSMGVLLGEFCWVEATTHKPSA